MKKSILIIGLGRFGQSVAMSLASMGHQVLVVDKSEEQIQNIADYVTEAMRADAMNEDFLRDIDIASYDAVVVAMGSRRDRKSVV